MTGRIYYWLAFKAPWPLHKLARPLDRARARFVWLG